MLLSAALAGGVAGPSAAQGPYEPAPRVRASEILPSRVLQSPYHRVVDDVKVSGNDFQMALESDFGRFETSSLAMLELRVHEVRTLARAMNQYARSNEKLVAELRGQLQIRSESVRDILVSPLTTAAELASQLTSNIGQTLTGDESRSGGEPRAADRFASVRSGTGAALAAHKRNIASQLGLDVYSSNPRVQEFLDVVARARSGGRIGAGVGLSPLPRDAGPVVAGGRLDREIESLIRRLSAPELTEGISDELERMGVSADLRRRFTRDSAFSPRQLTVIATYLDYLDRVRDRTAFIDAVVDAKDEREALSIARMARMFALYHDRVEPLRRFEAAAGLPLAVTRGHALLVILPVDTVYWSKRTDELFSALARFAETGRYPRRELAVSGTVTDRAAAALARLGFGVHPRFLASG